jgi:hypothetical protein
LNPRIREAGTLSGDERREKRDERRTKEEARSERRASFLSFLFSLLF